MTTFTVARTITIPNVVSEYIFTLKPKNLYDADSKIEFEVPKD